MKIPVNWETGTPVAGGVDIWESTDQLEPDATVTYQSEAEIEKECTDMVIALGGEHRKLDTGRGAKGELDHAYWLPRRTHFIVEYKVPGGKPSPLQARKIERLRLMGFEAHIIYSVEEFRTMLWRRFSFTVPRQAS